jgi:putative spermidine/putrescine transport system ATP-binding protein
VLLQADLAADAGTTAPATGQAVHLHWDARAVHALAS